MQLFTVIVSAFFLIVPLTDADQSRFEAASVKPDQCRFQNTVDPGMVALHGDPIKAVLAEAFKVKMDQIIGPSWLDSDCVSIDAKIPEGANKDQLPEMFQALLAERFKLAVHKENRQRSGYALVVDKNGPKFKKADLTSPAEVARAGQVTFGAAPRASQIKGAMTIASLARFVSGRLGVPVQDLTGLKGKYDIDVAWVPDGILEKPGRFAQEYAAAHPNSADGEGNLSTAPTSGIFSAFRNSLGLRLERQKEQIEVVVVDHIERVPTAN